MKHYNIVLTRNFSHINLLKLIFEHLDWKIDFCRQFRVAKYFTQWKLPTLITNICTVLKSYVALLPNLPIFDILKPKQPKLATLQILQIFSSTFSIWIWISLCHHCTTETNTATAKDEWGHNPQNDQNPPSKIIGHLRAIHIISSIFRISFHISTGSWKW